MFPRLLTIWHDVRTSLWALPLVMVIAAAAAAVLAVRIPFSPGADPVWFLYSGDAKEAPQLLSSLITAMITMATLVVSITMVVLVLAAQQLGPRLIRSFMADRRTQATLGLFVATVIYLLLVLRSTYGATNGVPNLAVTGGTALVLLCLVALLVFVHHLARSIIADNVIERVGCALDEDVTRFLPGPDFKEPSPPPKRPATSGAPLTLSRSGYVQLINHEGLVALAEEANAVIELGIKTGEHVVEGSRFAWIAPQEGATDDVRRNIEDCVAIGSERASTQDLQTSIRQLVEVALRALSPSLNDPFTAIAVVDRLTESLAKIMRRGPARRVWADGDGTARLIAATPDFSDFIDTAFQQIRQNSADMPSVLKRLVENLGQLLAQANDAQRPVLKKNVDIVLDTARRNITQKEDLEQVEAAAATALKH